MKKTDNNKETQEKWYKFWEEKGYFKANPDSPKKPYSLLMPPPNLTGELHLGHAMQHAIMDAIARFKRLQGFDVLLLPGVDHAGILFEGTLNRILAKEDLSKQKLGREEWLKRAWVFKDEMYQSFHKTWTVMGISADWSREVFTLDEKVQKAVFAEFKTFWEQELLYKGAYIVQWCPKCGTAIEDIEMEYQEKKEKLYYLKYGPLTLATTRPETKFGDTAMAVNPNDKRYKDYIDKEFEIETLMGKKKMKVIADDAVDPEFGTGVVKVTPGHDFTDYEIGKRHNLPIIHVIDKNGRLTEVAGKYKGMKVMEAREVMLPELREKGILIKEEEYIHQVPVCERCKTVIEPIISEEWFVKMEPLAKKALKHLKEINFLPKTYEKIISDWLKEIHDWSISRSLWWGHRIPVWYCNNNRSNRKKLGFADKVVPQLFAGKTITYRLTKHDFKIGDRVAFENSLTGKVVGFGTIKNIEETTVGELPLNESKHGATYKKREELIEAFKKYHSEMKIQNSTKAYLYEYEFTPREKTDEYCGLMSLSDKALKECPKCGFATIVQEEKVLDTWFSSGLWPFAVLQSKTAQVKPSSKFGFEDNMEKYYPWDFEITAPEIRYLWIARMIMLGLWFKDSVPFKNMFFHGMLRDLQGRKFSKSLGNGIDPLELIDQWGVDATRMALYTYAIPGREGRLSRQIFDERAKNFRNFITKLKNITRFVIELKPEKESRIMHLSRAQVEGNHESSEDHGIIKALRRTIEETTKYIDSFQLHLAVDEIYNFVWHDFADQYLEASKKRREEAQPVLEQILFNVLILLHPLMPFTTEELYQKFPKHQESIALEKWPKT